MENTTNEDTNINRNLLEGIHKVFTDVLNLVYTLPSIKKSVQESRTTVIKCV